MSEGIFDVLIAEPDLEFGKALEKKILGFENIRVHRFQRPNFADDFIWGSISRDTKSAAVSHEKSLIMISEYRFPEAQSAGMDLACQLRSAQKNAFIWLYSNEFEGTLSEGSPSYEASRYLREKKINGYCTKQENEMERMLKELQRQISLYSSKSRARTGATRKLPPIEKH